MKEIEELLKDVENPIEFIKQAKEINANIHKYEGVMKLLEKLCNFFEDTRKAGQPMMTEIRINITGEIDIPLLSLWAAVGENSPIKRISALRQQRDKMFDTLITLKNAIDYISQEENGEYIISKQDIDLINSAIENYKN